MVFSSIKEKLPAMHKSAAIESFKNLFPLIWPLFFQLITRRFVAPINAAFAGRVGTKELAAVGVSYGLVTVTAQGLGSGLALTFEAMAARSYGERKYHNVGILLQKAFIFAGFLCVLIGALWIHSGIILTAIGIPPDVAALSEKYLMLYIPAALGIFIFRLQRGYMILLRHVIPIFVVAVVGVVLLVPVNMLFMKVFHMGVEGIAISTDITFIAEVVAIFIYIPLSGIHKETWPGFTKKCFLGWKQYLAFALPGAFNFLLKIMIHEVALIAIGSLGDVSIAAQTALFTITKTILSIGFAVGNPINIYISKYFGEGNPIEAKTTAIVGILFNFSVSVVFAVSLVASKDIIGHIYTKDVEVIRLISKIVPYAAFSFLLESITTLLFIMCVALHLQLHSIIIYVVSSYVIGLPLGITLALYFKDITLLWCGLIVGFLIQFFMFIALFWWKVDFEKMSKEKQQSTLEVGKDMNSSAYMPLETSDESEEEDPKIYDTEKHIQSKQSKPCEGKKISEDEEVTSGLIAKRLLMLGTSVVILIISIVVRLYY